MSESYCYCDQESPGVATAISGMSADQVRELIQEARASNLCRLLEDASRGGGLARAQQPSRSLEGHDLALPVHRRDARGGTDASTTRAR